MIRLARATPLVAAVLALASSSCAYSARPAKGGGLDVKPNPQRPFDAADILVPDGYVVEPVAAGLTYPTGIAFDDKGAMFVVESGYAYGEDFTKPRIVEVQPGGNLREVAAGGNGPWNGIAYHGGAFFVSEGGESDGGRILRITPEGNITALVSGLPSQGDHHTNGPAVGPDGLVYFGQGTVTNSAVVGQDNLEFGWLKRHPELHDVPCKDVTLAGQNYTGKNPLKPDTEISTGAYMPLGKRGEKGEVVKGAVPCNGAIMRVPANGGPPELVAWGFRNPFGLAFGPDGKLYVSENGYDMRGSRQVFGAPDVLWRVEPTAGGTWYGWPEYSAGQPITGDRFKPPGQEKVKPVLAVRPNDPPAPVALFGVHSSSNGLDVSRNPAFGHVGEAFVAQFGDLTPASGKVLNPVGYRVVRVELTKGIITDFMSNRGSKVGPASLLKSGGLERPVAAKFDPTGANLYIVDFGVMTTSEAGPKPLKNTGMIWRVRRAGGTP